MKVILDYWEIIAFGLVALAWAVREWSTYRVKSDRSEQGRTRILSMINDLGNELNKERELRRDGDEDLERRMKNMRDQIRDRFVTEPRFDASIARIDEKLDAGAERIKGLEKKIDSLPENIANALKNEGL